jgi:hypothetical protein
MQMALAHYLIGGALRSSGKATEAAGHFRDAVRIWGDVRKEPGADKVLNRADLKPLYADASQAQSAKS